MKILCNRGNLTAAFFIVSLSAFLLVQTTQAQSNFKAGNLVSSNTASATPTKRDKEVVRREIMTMFFAKWDSATWGKIRKLLEESPSLINARPAGSGWLHRACQEGNLEAAEWLLARGMDVDVQSDGGGLTPLFYVRDVKVAKLLLEHGADVNIKNVAGRTALYEILANPLDAHPEKGDAQRVESEKIALLLMKYGADMNVEDHNGNTIFHALAQGKHYQWLGQYLRKGIGAKAKNKFGVGIWSALLSRGEDAVLDWLEKNGVTYDHKDKALVGHVVSYGNRHMMKKLQGKGLDIEEEDPLPRLTLLEKEIVKCNNTNAFNMLRACGAKIKDANKKHGGTPLLHSAVGNAEFTRQLLNYGADPEGKDYKGVTPLYTAILLGSPEVLGLLVDHGADMNQALVTESDTLCWVGWRDETKHQFVRLHNVTPLLLAVCGWRKNIVELLLAHGVDVNLRTAEGYTVLAVAEKLHKKDIAALLRQKGGVE